MKFNSSVSGLEKLQELSGSLDQLATELSGPFQIDAATSIAEHIARRAAENAPILENNLRPAIAASPATASGDSAQATVGVPDSIEYAAIMYKHLTPFGASVGVSKFTGRPIYSLGPISRVMPGTVEGGVGGIFIQRVAVFHKSQYEQAIGDALISLLQSQSRRRFRFVP